MELTVPFAGLELAYNGPVDQLLSGPWLLEASLLGKRITITSWRPLLAAQLDQQYADFLVRVVGLDGAGPVSVSIKLLDLVVNLTAESAVVVITALNGAYAYHPGFDLYRLLPSSISSRIGAIGTWIRSCFRPAAVLPP